MPLNSSGRGFSKMRRFLQGRGVDYRRFTGAGVASAAALTVTGMKHVDELVSYIRYPVSAGNLQDAIELLTETAGVATQASVTMTTLTDDITWTAQSPSYEGSKGNVLQVELLDNGANKPLSVDVIAAASAQEGKVSVQLATNAGGTILSTSNDVVDAVQAHPQAASMVAGKIAVGTGTSVVIAVAAVTLTSGADANAPATTRVNVAAVQAFIAPAQAGADNLVTYNAQLPLYPGAKGNNLSIELLNNGNSKPLVVDVISGAGGQETKVSVQLATDSGGTVTSTANQIIDAIAAHPQAKEMIYAESSEGTGDGVAVAFAATSLSSGADETVTIANAATAATDKVQVDFLAHRQ